MHKPGFESDAIYYHKLGQPQLYNLDIDFGFEIEIYKNIKPGSGIGSSAASAVGSVFGMNELLGKPFNKTELTAFAIKGEAWIIKFAYLIKFTEEQ